MNGLEALENISITFDEGGYEPTTLGAKSGHFIEVFGDDFRIIEKDLERLEKLEEEYQKLEAQNNKENIRLLYNQSYLIAKVEKLKQAVDILKDKMNLAVYHNKVYNIYSIDLLKFKEDFEDKLSQEEYELLKEVLENE